MKRLLAAGSGSIYQVCKAFRNGEAGRWHNPEFTILEWYRLDFDLPQLMDEVAALLTTVLGELPVNRISYQQLFQRVTGLDPLCFSRDDYGQYAVNHGLAEADRLCEGQHEQWLDLLFSHCVQPAMQPQTIYLVYDYPAIQSSLARISTEDPRVAERFEVFVNGAELGNGFHELRDAGEQDARFEREIAFRQRQGLPAVEKDRLFLDALTAGLPDCSGVAIGLDRLLMMISSCDAIEQVLAFPISRC